jgi:hypothetical protein
MAQETSGTKRNANGATIMTRVRWVPPPHHHHHSHAAPVAARITDAILHVHYRHSGEFHVSTATIAGSTPTQRTDGTSLALTDIATIDVFDDVGDGSGPQKIGSLPNPAQTFSFTTGVLAAGKTHSFSVIVNDVQGHSSAISNIAQLQVPATLASPAPVTDLTATLNLDSSSSAAPAPSAPAAPAVT